MFNLKRIIVYLFAIFFILLISNSNASNIVFNGKATGTNLDLDFSSTYSNTYFDSSLIINNVCGLGYTGFKLTGYVDTTTIGYVRFVKDSNTCVGLVLDSKKWYLIGTGFVDNDESYISFNKIEGIYKSDSTLSFSGSAETKSFGLIDYWSNVYLSGLSMLDWSKSNIDYSNCKNGYYVNGTPCYINISLKDYVGNAYTSLTSINVSLSNISSDYNGYIYLGTGGDSSLTVSVDSTGLVKIPVYILKVGDNISFKLHLSYDKYDIDLNKEKNILVDNISSLSPLKSIDVNFLGDLSIGNDITGFILPQFINTGSIDNYILSGGFKLTGNVREFVINKGKNINSKNFIVNIGFSGVDDVVKMPKLILSNSSKFVIKWGSLFGGGKYTFLDIPVKQEYDINLNYLYINGLANNVSKMLSYSINRIGRGNFKISQSLLYNFFKRKVLTISRGVEYANVSSIYIDSLKGGVKAYDCNSGYIEINGGTYEGNNLLILKNCKLNIKGNIYKLNSSDSLVVFLYSDKVPSIDNGFDTLNSVFISENVSDIYMGIITNSFVTTLNGSNVSYSNVIIGSRYGNINDKQLYYKGVIISKNNIGGSLSFFDGKSKYYILWGNKRIYDGEKIFGDNSDIGSKVKIFDLNYWRGFKFNSKGIANDWYSYYCSENKNIGKCKFATIIDYDTAIIKNIIFK